MHTANISVKGLNSMKIGLLLLMYFTLLALQKGTISYIAMYTYLKCNCLFL